MNLLLRFPFAATAFAGLAPKSYLHRVGWMRSFRFGRPVDMHGSPMPWVTYPCFAFLAERWKAEWTVLEFGSGYSTLWFASQGSPCFSLESDPAWADEVRRRLASVSAVEVALCASLDLVPELIGPRTFDVIFIDGTLSRLESFSLSIGNLSERGFVVWDNSDREEYSRGLEIARGNGFRALDFSGPIPCSIVGSRTSIMYRDGNVLGI